MLWLQFTNPVGDNIWGEFRCPSNNSQNFTFFPIVNCFGNFTVRLTCVIGGQLESGLPFPPSVSMVGYFANKQARERVEAKGGQGDKR